MDHLLKPGRLPPTRLAPKLGGMQMNVDTVVVSPDGTYPLYVTAKRYWVDQIVHKGGLHGAKGHRRSDSWRRSRGRGLTLILLHSSSFHKETWEACIQTLFELSEASEVWIEEAWSIEAPNHGESALLNAQMFSVPPFSEHFGCEGYSRAVHRFLTRGPVAFHDKKLVGIGHSLGANTILMIQTFIPRLPFAALIIVEPMVSPNGDKYLEALRARLVHSARKRRDMWRTREQARFSLPGKDGIGAKKSGRRQWDERVVESFINHGIVPVTNASDLLLTSNSGKVQSDDLDIGVTAFALACTKKQEIIMYSDTQGSVAPVQVLDHISSKIPVHLILGEVKDFLSDEIHAALTSPVPGRQYASLTVLPDVGHLIPQEDPDGLAKALLRILLQSTSTPKL